MSALTSSDESPSRVRHVLLLLIISFSAAAQALDTLSYSSPADFRYFGDKMYRLNPETGQQEPGEGSVINFGYSQQTEAFYFYLSNQGQQPLYLMMANPLLDSVLLYKKQGGRFEMIGQAGDKLDFNNRVYPGQYPVLDLRLNPGETAEYLLRTSAEEQMLVPARVGILSEIIDFTFKNDLLFVLYIAIMAVMFFYNFFLYYTTRDRSYLYYVLYIFGIAMAQAGLNGYLFRLFPMAGFWNLHFANAIFSTIAGLSAIAFARYFLQLKERAPYFDKGMYVFITIYSLVVPVFFFSPVLSYNLLDIGAVFVAIYALVFSIYLSIKKYRTARFFLFAWIFFMAGLVIFALKNQGIINSNIFTDNVLELGSAIETVLISLALADRINLLKQEKAESQADALRAAEENRRIISEQNVVLESRVEERTAALLQSNSELERTLSDLRSAQAQLVNAEKMASLGQLTAGVAHEINNPINFVSSNIKPLSRDIEDLIAIIEAFRNVDQDNFAEQREKAESLMKRLDYQYLLEEIAQLMKGMEDGASRTVEIVKGLKNFSRLDEAEKKLANINEGVESTIILLNSSMRGKVQIDKNLGELPMIECYPGKLNQVFMNLMNNAIYAIQQRFQSEPGGILSIHTAIENREVVIRIGDNGIGMPENIVKNIFDPFFTTKPVGDGTGLGLSIVYSIIESHQGRISVASEIGVGTTFTIYLPQLLGSGNVPV